MRPLPLLALLTLTTPLAAQTSLHQQLLDLSAQSKGHLYIACSLPGVALDCDLDPHGHPPMQSTFKLPLAFAVLHEVELGKLQLDQPIRFLKSDRSETYSPLQEEFPAADVDVSLRKLIQLSVETSDNTATDIELRLIGGPSVLQHYLDDLGLAIHQQDSEHTLHTDQKLQYRDYAEPAAMVALLRLFADRSPLTPEHTALLNTWMLNATGGPKRIRGLLPPGTPVAHKTGSSGEEYGMIPATNDVGLITLPPVAGKPEQRLALAIFLTDAHVDQATAESILARATRAIYDAATAPQNH
jgi:beta-lactamase class A